MGACWAARPVRGLPHPRIAARGPREGEGRERGLRSGMWPVRSGLTGVCPSPAGERAENAPDLLQEVREAPAAQGHAVQEGEGLALRAG